MSSEWNDGLNTHPQSRPLESASLPLIKELSGIFDSPEVRAAAVIEAEVNARAATLANAAASLALSYVNNEAGEHDATAFLAAIDSLNIKDILIQHMADEPDADYVNYLRGQAGLTYPEIAERAGKSIALISRVLRKERKNTPLLKIVMQMSKERIAAKEQIAEEDSK